MAFWNAVDKHNERWLGLRLRRSCCATTQPHSDLAFLTKYQDPDEYPVYFRVLETDDEYFDYYRKRHAFWKMYGLALPDQALKKIYYKNALKLIPSIDKSAFPD